MYFPDPGTGTGRGEPPHGPHRVSFTSIFTNITSTFTNILDGFTSKCTSIFTSITGKFADILGLDCM